MQLHAKHERRPGEVSALLHRPKPAVGTSSGASSGALPSPSSKGTGVSWAQPEIPMSRWMQLPDKSLSPSSVCLAKIAEPHALEARGSAKESRPLPALTAYHPESQTGEQKGTTGIPLQQRWHSKAGHLACCRASAEGSDL